MRGAAPRHRGKLYAHDSPYLEETYCAFRDLLLCGHKPVSTRSGFECCSQRTDTGDTGSTATGHGFTKTNNGHLCKAPAGTHSRDATAPGRRRTIPSTIARIRPTKA